MTHFFPYGELQECGRPTSPVLSGYLIVASELQCLFCNSLVCRCPHVNDELGTGACGKCISGEGEVASARLMECSSLCIVGARQVVSLTLTLKIFSEQRAPHPPAGQSIDTHVYLKSCVFQISVNTNDYTLRAGSTSPLTCCCLGTHPRSSLLRTNEPAPASRFLRRLPALPHLCHVPAPSRVSSFYLV